MPRPSVLTAASLRLAQQRIAAADNTMAAAIAANPPCRLARRRPPFAVLITSIINQQLSQKAAATIERRVELLVPPPFAAEDWARASPAKLRAAGMSAGKIRYAQNLVDAARAGALDESALRRLPDEAVIARLTAINGIGRWTAEMFLMFALRRPDVLSAGDAGLRRAARALYGRRFAGDDAAVLTKAAARWRPWRTVGCWHLWRSLEKRAPPAGVK